MWPPDGFRHERYRGCLKQQLTVTIQQKSAEITVMVRKAAFDGCPRTDGRWRLLKDPRNKT
jgi:hypothetical protein